MIGSEGQPAGPGTLGLILVTAVVVVFLVAPVVIIVVVSLSGTEYLSLPPQSLSWRWYARFLGDPAWQGAIVTSLQVAGLTTVFATSLGVLAALGWSGASFAPNAWPTRSCSAP